MGKNLHYSILPFIEKALTGHSKVATWEREDHPTEYIYKIKRTGTLSEILLHVSDVYQYDLTCFFNKPDSIRSGCMILLAKPESTYGLELTDIVKGEQISIGKIGEILGALNLNEHWEWESKERKQKRRMLAKEN